MAAARPEPLVIDFAWQLAEGELRRAVVPVPALIEVVLDGEPGERIEEAWRCGARTGANSPPSRLLPTFGRATCLTRRTGPTRRVARCRPPTELVNYPDVSRDDGTADVIL
jgi:hypothetical protein